MMATKKQKLAENKATKQKKQRRRQWITFIRMCRYGVNNFTRNAWLTIAAMAVMTITLLIVFMGVVSHQVLVDTVSQLRDRVNMSIYLKTETTQEDAATVVGELRKLSSVVDVSAKSPDQAREQFVEDNKDNADTLDALKEATNKFPWTISIRVQDINKTDELTSFVAENETAKPHIDPDRAPSFAGERRQAITSIGRAASFAQQIGIIASAVFISISMLIIFNTIRMAIFNRREEIQMMKLIGAERSFIRGPFVVEAVVYGFFAALIASAIGYGLLILAAPSLKEAEVNVQPIVDTLMFYAGFVVLGMIILGGIIGVVSSMLATRRYLKL